MSNKKDLKEVLKYLDSELHYKLQSVFDDMMESWSVRDKLKEMGYDKRVFRKWDTPFLNHVEEGLHELDSRYFK